MHFEVKNANLKFQKALNARVGSPGSCVYFHFGLNPVPTHPLFPSVPLYFSLFPPNPQPSFLLVALKQREGTGFVYACVCYLSALLSRMRNEIVCNFYL